MLGPYGHKERFRRLRLVVLVVCSAMFGWTQERPFELQPHIRVEGRFQQEYEIYNFSVHKGQYARISITASGSELEALISDSRNSIGSKLWVAPSESKHVLLVSDVERHYSIRIARS